MIAATSLDRIIAYLFCKVTGETLPVWMSINFTTPLLLMSSVWKSFLQPVCSICCLCFNSKFDSLDWLTKQKKNHNKKEAAKKKSKNSNSSYEDLESTRDSLDYPPNPHRFPLRRQELCGSSRTASSSDTQGDSNQGNNLKTKILSLI